MKLTHTVSTHVPRSSSACGAFKGVPKKGIRLDISSTIQTPDSTGRGKTMKRLSSQPHAKEGGATGHTTRGQAIDTWRYKPHSISAVSTSLAHSRQVPIDTILKSAELRSTCTFAQHYKRPLRSGAESKFSRVVLIAASAQ
ncbi:hypothetical protein ElyMa_000053500 [Elysia marginata]|uniref:Uncharacterized protein n=1 Tax=Elysia marginata TaxID=1093978 RepID=A0AAV4EFD6_9GAST|nr:hypothetical protein ElyMa_000053500 [Elysia marginata]